MVRIRLENDPEACRRHWRELWPCGCFFDLWDVRWIFAESFSRSPSFLVAEQGDRAVGMLALSFLEERQSFAHFPGELWQNKTWIEQNRIPAVDRSVRDELVAAVPGPTHLRYLTPDSSPSAAGPPFAVDEENFRFHPESFDFSFDKYMLEFSHKSRKNFARELAGLERHGVAYRYDHPADIDQLLTLNRGAYGDYSYFADSRFLNAFVRLCGWLSESGMLRITTLLLGGRIAAVDVGAVCNGQYTVLAGGTDSAFPGVAKMINFHHLAWACDRRLSVVDFLCGDFGWKKRFHLTPHPLYELHLDPCTGTRSTAVAEESALA